MNVMSFGRHPNLTVLFPGYQPQCHVDEARTVYHVLLLLDKLFERRWMSSGDRLMLLSHWITALLWEPCYNSVAPSFRKCLQPV